MGSGYIHRRETLAFELVLILHPLIPIFVHETYVSLNLLLPVTVVQKNRLEPNEKIGGSARRALLGWRFRHDDSYR